MLSLSPASRRRLASGGAAVAALAVAGLGLTASGSSAAAIGAGVKDAVGQAAPPTLADPAPDASGPRKVKTVVVVKGGKTQTYEGAEADAYLAAHPVREMPAPPELGKGARSVRTVVIVKDGKTTVSDAADIDAHLAAGDRVAIDPLGRGSSRIVVKADGSPDNRIELRDIPAISAAHCGIGPDKPSSMVIDSGAGQTRRIVICTDRIKRVTANAVASSVDAHEIERTAYTRALAGLTDARTRIEGNADMTAVDRARAMTAIDQSITEMKARVAHVD